MTRLEIHNAGPAIASSNYWDTELAKAGAVFVSVNARAFRLLLPDVQKASLADMRTASEVIVSRGPWPARGRDDAIEVLFDEGSASPFVLHFGVEQIDRMPTDANIGPLYVCTVWTRGPTLELLLPAHYRRSAQLPDLRPWPSE